MRAKCLIEPEVFYTKNFKFRAVVAGTQDLYGEAQAIPTNHTQYGALVWIDHTTRSGRVRLTNLSPKMYDLSDPENENYLVKISKPTPWRPEEITGAIILARGFCPREGHQIIAIMNEPLPIVLDDIEVRIVDEQVSINYKKPQKQEQSC